MNTSAPDKITAGLLGTKEAAAYLSIGRTTLYDLINSGAVRTVRIGRKSVRIPVEDLQRIAREGWERPE